MKTFFTLASAAALASFANASNFTESTALELDAFEQLFVTPIIEQLIPSFQEEVRQISYDSVMAAVPKEGACESDCRDQIKANLKFAENTIADHFGRVMHRLGSGVRDHLLETTEALAMSATTHEFDGLRLSGYSVGLREADQESSAFMEKYFASTVDIAPESQADPADFVETSRIVKAAGELAEYLEDIVTDLHGSFSSDIEDCFFNVDWKLKNVEVIDGAALDKVLDGQLSLRWKISGAEMVERLRLVQMDWSDEVIFKFEDQLEQPVEQAFVMMDIVNNEHNDAWRYKRDLESQGVW